MFGEDWHRAADRQRGSRPDAERGALLCGAEAMPKLLGRV